MSTALHHPGVRPRTVVGSLYIACSILAWGLSFFAATSAIAPSFVGAMSLPWSLVAIALGAGSVLPIASIMPVILAGNLVNILLVLRARSPRSG